jgi:hypothetical protein
MIDAIELLRNAVVTSDIKHVAIVDDAFDPPEVKSEVLYDFMHKTPELQVEICEKEVWDKAILHTANNEDTDEVAAVVERLYEKYVHYGESKFDPGNTFKVSREDNLKFVRPILEFFKTCAPVNFKTFGSEALIKPEDKIPDLVLVDLYLDPEISTTELPDEATANAATNKSVARVKHLLGNDPPIILMSSYGEKGRAAAEGYRSQFDNKVYASRFGFVDKGHVKIDPQNGFLIAPEARDTLIDIFQTYKFGKALTEAINRWLSSTKEAVTDIEKDIHRLQLKEIAYLVQFRLAAEGQGLEEYLEWFFGEALLDYIIRATDKAHAINPLEQSLDISSVKSIDGAFGPTQEVAKMYHRVRIEGNRSRLRKNFRLGDLYLDVAKKDVVAVMTPDCDLVLRKAGASEKRNADHLLLVRGNISDIEETYASLGDFLMIGETPHNIEWKYKKVFSAPFEGTFAIANQSGADYQYLGTLRPLYAQEIQAHLLSHIGRVGVAVPPVIGLPAIATIVIKTKNGTKNLSSEGVTYPCNLIPGRSSDNPSRVVFDREIQEQIKAAFLDITEDGLIDGSVANVKAVKADKAKRIEKALKFVPEIGKELACGICFAKGRYEKMSSWAGIYITSVPGEIEIAKDVLQAEPVDGTVLTEVTQTTASIIVGTIE